MKGPKLLANENFDQRVVEGLRRLQYDIVTMADLGIANRQTPDEVVLAWATQLDRAVLTLNHRDFRRLHRRLGGVHAGIVSCTPDPDPSALAVRIHDRLRVLPSLASVFLRITR